MLTFYCPECWAIIPEEYVSCPHCGFDLSQFSRSTYEEKLLKALHHTVQERQLIAAEVLGKIGSRRALPEFDAILQTETENYFLLRAVIEATAKIPDPRRREILEKTAKQHPSPLIQHLAEELLAALPSKDHVEETSDSQSET